MNGSNAKGRRSLVSANWRTDGDDCQPGRPILSRAYLNQCSEEAKGRFTPETVAALQADNRMWPEKLTTIPMKLWRPDWHEPDHLGGQMIGVMRSREFFVRIYDIGGGVVRISVIRTEPDPASGRWVGGISWEELQRLKTETGYGACQAIEIFPEDSHVVDIENIRHLWVMPVELSFAWRVEDQPQHLRGLN